MSLKPKDLDGKPIGEVLTRVQKHMERHMPRDYNGCSMRDAVVTADQDKKALRFTWPDGTSALADGQAIGVLVEKGVQPGASTFEWAWNQEEIRPEMLRHALVLKAWGEANKVQELMIRAVEGRAERYWVYAMLAAVLNGAESVTGLQRNNALVLMTVGPMRAGN
jgi:hypothetical protein